MAGLAGTFRKGLDLPCPRPIMNVRLPTGRDSGRGSSGPDAAGSRVARRAAPDWSRRAGFPRSSRKPQAQPVGILGGRGKGSAGGVGRGGVEAARLVGGACPAGAAGPRLRERRGLEDSPEMIPQSETEVGQQYVPRGRASPQQAPPGSVHPGPAGA